MTRRQIFELIISATTDFAVLVMTSMLASNVQKPTWTMVMGGAVAFLRTVQQRLKKDVGNGQ